MFQTSDDMTFSQEKTNKKKERKEEIVEESLNQWSRVFMVGDLIDVFVEITSKEEEDKKWDNFN